MAAIEGPMPAGTAPAARTLAVGLTLAAAIVGAAIVLFLFTAPDLLKQTGLTRSIDAVTLSLYAAGVAFIALGGIVAIVRLGLGGTIALIGTLFWLAGCISFKSFNWVVAIPLVLAFLGALTPRQSSPIAYSRSGAP
jgi:hypothetical protein